MDKILKRYNALVERNYHTEAAALLVENFGTDEEKEIMKGIAERYSDEGISPEDYRLRFETSNKYYKLLIRKP